MKKHLKAVQKVPEHLAVAARVNFKRNITRTRVSSELRSIKPRTYEIKRCSFDHCQKNVKRIHNHLKTVYQLSGEEYKRKLKEAVVAPEGTCNTEQLLGITTSDKPDDSEQEKG